MEGQVVPVGGQRGKSAHLMCGTPIWGIAGLLACSYLAYLSYSHVRRAEFYWPHDAWSIATYAVWVLLILGLLTETRCWRERIFFALVLANFTLGFALAGWGNAPKEAVYDLRVISVGFWGLAAVVCLFLTFSPGKSTAADRFEQDPE